MNGFGTIQTRNINEIVASIEKQIREIKSDFSKDYTVLSNKLEKCELDLKNLKTYISEIQDYTETEYNRLQAQINEFEAEIETIKSNLNSVKYNESEFGTVAVGIAPLSSYSATSATFPFSAKYANNDSNGNNIVETYATKTELNNEITRANETEQYITDNLTGEITRSMGVENTISADLSNEVIRATNKEIQLQQNIDTLSNTVNDKETTLNNKIDAEIIRSTSAENDLNTSISNEITAREYADSDLQTQINAISASIPIEIDSVISAINAEIERATETEETLDDKIDSSVETLSENINDLNTSLSQALDSEITNRTNDVSALSGSIEEEIANRTASVSALQNDLINETSARSNADKDLQAQIDTIEATQNVVDIVGTYEELVIYDTSQLKDGVKIQVLTDEEKDYASTIYEFDKPTNTFSFVGVIGSYYTKAETDSFLNSKQNNLSAGDGINITNDVISHSIKIIENNNQEDTVEGTVFTVYLKNNHYKIITFNKTITEIIFMIEKSAQNVLQETGFEFTVPEDSELETLTFKVINDNNKKIYTIIPDSYSSPNIYQGTIVNYRCTIGEYEVED